MALIRTEREYELSKLSLLAFEEEVKERSLQFPQEDLKRKQGESEKVYLNRVALFQGAYMINQIQEELEEYEGFKKGKIPVEYYTLDNIGLLLTALRIKNGLTIEQMAEKLRMSTVDYDSWECNEFYGTSIGKIRQILEIMNENVELKVGP